MKIKPALTMLLIPLIPLIAGAQLPTLTGFSVERSEQHREWESVMAAVPDVARMGEFHYDMTRLPHHAGTEENYRLALYLQGLWEELGFETELVRYDVYLPWPGERSLRLVEPEVVELAVTEPPIAADPDTYVEGVITGMAAYVTPGDVVGDVVYANYGRSGDYRLLEERGVSLDGRIVLVRYGGTPAQMRGMKVREAAMRGAVGVVIYSDPEDDGYVRGDVYPDGTWRPPEGIQSGSFLDVPIYPGDPLTPFVPSIPGVQRLAFEDAETIQKIPVQPISYGEALKILRHIGGDVVPQEWQGGLPLAYHIGAGPARVEMHVEYDYAQRPVWNVFGKIEGTVEPEKFILAAGHRDAWALGARDPTSGAVSLLETARGIATALEQGYRPRRSIVFGSWGGEEYFLLGSTEWGEQFGEQLRENMVAYINRESYTAGDWSASGNHSLERFVIETSRDAVHPQAPSLYDAWSMQEPGAPPRLGAPGSGSDFTVFIDHLGIPSLSLGYGSGNGVYHSLYDTLGWFQRFGDPDYEYGVAQADMVGRMLMRLASAEILPFDFTDTADVIGRYVDELVELDAGGRLRDELRGIGAANARLRAAAVEANMSFSGVLSGGSQWTTGSEDALREINRLIMQTERELLDERGIWRRPWYRNLIYAPGYYEGYAAKTLPGVREAIEHGDWEVAQAQATMLVEALERAATSMTSAANTARRVQPEARER
jgi:N-acetylated-alpha-linked acidic dipeptidase